MFCLCKTLVIFDRIFICVYLALHTIASWSIAVAQKRAHSIHICVYSISHTIASWSIVIARRRARTIPVVGMTTRFKFIAEIYTDL